MARRALPATAVSTVSALALGSLALVGAPSANAVPCSSADFASGSGTSSDPYRVATAAQLAAVANCLDKAFLQTADITLSGPWTPIGDSSGDATYFSGVYDGGCHSISGLSITSSEYEDELGLFGSVGGATLKNIRLESVSITGGPSGPGPDHRGDGQYIGGLAGNSDASTISAVSVSGTITATGQGNHVGMLIGTDTATSIVTHVTTSGTITATGDSEESSQGAGGLFAYGPKSLTESYSTVNITGDQRVGGLVADTSSGTGITFQNNYSTGTLDGNGSGGSGVGGLIAEVSAALTITNSFAAGIVTAHPSEHGGGIIGVASPGGAASYASSVWDSAVTTQPKTAKVGYYISSGGGESPDLGLP